MKKNLNMKMKNEECLSSECLSSECLSIWPRQPLKHSNIQTFKHSNIGSIGSPTSVQTFKHSSILPLFFLFQFSIFNFASAQTDSVAARIIDRYLDILNIEALPQDSMLVLTTTITKQGGGDTVVMTRLFQKPQMFRVDVRDSQGLQTGLCSNGKDRFRAYPYQGDWWGDIKPEDFYNRLTGFDFRGPLYNWRINGLELTYLGKVDVDNKGVKLDAVRVETSTTYPRTYFFEESGLLCLIIEDDVMSDGIAVLKDTHIDWKCEHEYGRVGETVLPTLESFLRHGEQTVLSTEMHFEKRDNLRFNQD